MWCTFLCKKKLFYVEINDEDTFTEPKKKLDPISCIMGSYYVFIKKAFIKFDRQFIQKAY
jgi:hypothetical protein